MLFDIVRRQRFAPPRFPRLRAQIAAPIVCLFPSPGGGFALNFLNFRAAAHASRV